jgi:hypothetical protein
MTPIYRYLSREEAEVENVGYIEVWYILPFVWFGCYSLWTEA